jgi:hypothetical protein
VRYELGMLTDQEAVEVHQGELGQPALPLDVLQRQAGQRVA